MPYKLFLDDERMPPFKHQDAVVLRSFEDAVYFTALHGAASFISFDHDLGGAETGYDFAKWLVEMDMDFGGEFIPEDFTFDVHSANPVGKENIEKYLNRYLEQRHE